MEVRGAADHTQPPCFPREKMSSVLQKAPAIVGTIHSLAALREALRLKNGAVDFFEVRVDHFAADPGPLRRALPKLKARLIVTVRHPAEGGAGALSTRERRALYLDFLPHAAFVDLELRSCETLRDIREAAGEAGVGLIVSHHRFDSTPTLERLREKAAAARRVRPDVFKIASLTSTAQDVATLLTFLAATKQPPALSAMGMGPFGKVSRLALAQAGSVLNYGYLGDAQLPGQWSARLLRERLAEL